MDWDVEKPRVRDFLGVSWESKGGCASTKTKGSPFRSKDCEGWWLVAVRGRDVDVW